MVVFALAAADDLAVAFGRQQVVAQDGARVVRVLLHVERLGPLGVVVHEDGLVEPAGDRGFLHRAQVLAPLEGTTLVVQALDRLGVADAGERRRYRLQPRRVAPQRFQLGGATVEGAGRHVRDQRLLERHVVVRVRKRHRGLNHPELGQVAARLGLFGAEGGAEAVDLAERRARALGVELARLRKEGALAEVVGLE